MRANLKIVAVALTAAVLATSASQAQVRRQESVTVFYSDEQHSAIVGQTVFFCDGGRTHIGSFSLYDEELYYGCN